MRQKSYCLFEKGTGKLIAVGPAEVKQAEDGPAGVAFEALDGQEAHLIGIPESLAELAPSELFAAARLIRKSETELADVRPRTERGRKKKE